MIHKIKEIIKKDFASLFWHEKWNIGLIEINPEDLFFQKEVKQKIWWFPEREGFYYADPFLIKKDKKIYIFFEQYQYKTRKGQIAFSEAKKENDEWHFTEAKVISKEDQHLSYPFVFKYKNNIYMLPETGEAREIVLYKAVKFPYSWQKEKVLVPDFPGIDNTLLFYNNLWWIFSADRRCPNKTLHIYFSQNLLGDWQPHMKNPIYKNNPEGRPAGKMFSYQDNLFRPSQDCSEKYGKRIVLNKVKQLTPYQFVEEDLVDLCPGYLPKNPYQEGLHTFSYSGNLVAIDSKKNASGREVLQKFWSFLLK